MPIALGTVDAQGALVTPTPHHHDPGHGQQAVDYFYVEIVGFQVFTALRRLNITLQYGNPGPSGEWLPSPEPVHVVRIQNHPAITSEGYDPNAGGEGIPGWVTQEVEPARPDFDNLVDAFILVQAHVGMRGYDAVGMFLYQYLLDNNYYEGEII